MQRRTLFASSILGAFAASSVSAKTQNLPALASSVTDEVVPTAAKPVLLNFNENSLGMSAKAKDAVVKGLATAFRYPDQPKVDLTNAIAKFYGVEADLVTLGAGSSEILQAVVQAQVEKARHAGKKVQLVEPVPTFGIVAGYAAALNVPVVDVPVKMDTLEVDVPALKKAVESFDGVSIVYYCNPNNPTSTVTPATVLNGWIEEAAAKKAPVFFLLDEAYAEYVTDPKFVSGVELVKKGLTNLTVARTFSKLYALAGLRIGFGISAKPTAKLIGDFVSVDSINFGAAVAATASLSDTTFRQLSLETTALSRAIVEKTLKELGVEYIPSQANFIFHRCKGQPGEYKAAMAKLNVIVGREFAPIVGWNRLTLGTPGEMKAWVKAVKAVHKQGLI